MTAHNRSLEQPRDSADEQPTTGRNAQSGACRSVCRFAYLVTHLRLHARGLWRAKRQLAESVMTQDANERQDAEEAEQDWSSVSAAELARFVLEAARRHKRLGAL